MALTQQERPPRNNHDHFPAWQLFILGTCRSPVSSHLSILLADVITLSSDCQISRANCHYVHIALCLEARAAIPSRQARRCGVLVWPPHRGLLRFRSIDRLLLGLAIGSDRPSKSPDLGMHWHLPFPVRRRIRPKLLGCPSRTRPRRPPQWKCRRDPDDGERTRNQSQP